MKKSFRIHLILLTLLGLMFFLPSNLKSQTYSVTIILDSATGQCAYVSDFYPTGNVWPYPDLAGVAWTQFGVPYVGRTFFQFYLNVLPSNVYILSAFLSLYANPTPTQPPHSGQNASILRRVIQNWNQQTVTWNNQPSYTFQNQVPLPQSTSSTEDYLNIDVTNMVKDMIQFPNLSYGFMLELGLENIYRSLNFASSYNMVSSKWPKLVITYNLVGITPISTTVPEKYNLFQNFPNPFNPSTTIKFDVARNMKNQSGETFVKIVVYDILGRQIVTLVNENLKPGSYETRWDASSIPSGVYVYKIIAGDFISAKRMMLIK